MRCPCRRISPEATRPGGSSRPMMEAPVSDFPAPDSPTTPRISPGAMSKEISSSARSVPWRLGNSTTRFLTCKRLIVLFGGTTTQSTAATGSTSSETRVQGITQPVTQQVDRQGNQHQHETREDRDPPFTREQVVIAKDRKSV